MLGAPSSSKRYGRGTTGDSIFGRKPSSDPFVFDSDSEGSPVKAKSAPVKKKAQQKPSHADSSTATGQVGKKHQTKAMVTGKAKDNKKSSASNVEDNGSVDHLPQRSTTRSHSSSSSKDSYSGYPSMQIISTTVYQSDTVDRESDFENTEPMTISSETVKVTTDDGYGSKLIDTSLSAHNSTGATQSQFNIRPRTHSNASSVDSNDSRAKRPTERQRRPCTRSRSSSIESQHSEFLEKTLPITRPVESDRMKRFLGLSESKTTTPSVSSQSSPDAPVESNHEQRFFKSSSNKVNGRAQPASQESDRFKKFLQSDVSEITNIVSKTNSHSRRKHSKETENVKSGRKKLTKAPTEKYSKLVESDRLKKFLEMDASNVTNSVDSDNDSDISSDSLDKTLVPNDQRHESKRLREFLGADSKSNGPLSDSSSSRASSPAEVLHEPTKSSRLQAFLQSGDGGTTSRDSSRKLTSVRTAGKRSSNNQTGSPNKHSGLSQEMDEVRLHNGLNDKPSPPKRRFMSDRFNFDSDSDDHHASGLSTANKGKAVSDLKKTSGDNVKPVINFEKMEGLKTKSTDKPVKKLLGTTRKPSKYSYNHRAWLDDKTEEAAMADGETSSHRKESQPLRHPLGLRKVVKYPVNLGERISNQVKVRQDQKRLYTVVRNVRQAHECQDHGENQQIDDDLEFLLEGLEPREQVSSRYLSAVSLAKKCTNAAFRMHLRSHSSLSQIFTSLSDASSDPRLALSTTAIMFMLCQDRLNMDLDRNSLKLMVELLEYDDRAHLDNSQDIADYEKSINTVYDLYKSAIPVGEELLEKSDLSPGYLAMECLLVLTSRRSGDWFKEELREAGAIVCIADSIINKTITVMSADYDMELSANVLLHTKKICRGLRVLEHVTAYNTGNQALIIKHKGGEFVLSLGRLLMFGVEALPTHSIDQNSPTSAAGHLILQKLLGVLRVLVNVTHNSTDGCSTVNSFSGIIEILLKCILQSAQYVLDEQRFDLLVLGLGLSINMCEHSVDCRQTLLDSETLSSYDSICEQDSMLAAEALLLLFNQRLRAAKKIEAETGQLQESDITRAVSDEANESITEVLHKAGRHMEDTIVASYIALLIGVIVQNSPDYIDQIKHYLANNSFDEIIDVLQKFLSFMKMADAASGNTGSKSIGTVIAYLKECT